MKPTSLEDLYAKFRPVAGEAPADMQRELGQFDVFSLGSLRPGQSHRPPTPFNRQAFYKISLSHGEGRFEFVGGFSSIHPYPPPSYGRTHSFFRRGPAAGG